MGNCGVIALLTAACLGVCCGQAQEKPRHPQRVELSAEGKQWVEETLASLSLEEKVGQMLQVRCFGDYASFENIEYKQLRDTVQKYHIGSLLLSLHFNATDLIRISPLAEAAVANQLQRESRLPLLLAADLERGVSSRFTDVPSFPWPMAFGAIGDATEVERFAAITARQARAAGIHWALAPVADINNNPANPIINIRSFGEDPAQVSVLVEAFIRGARENGLLVSVKHFPGHGDTVVDSHHGVPVIGGTREHLQQVELLPFKRAIAAGADSVLLAHASVPALEPDSRKVATVSFPVVTSLLKGELGFQGVVVTDALEMSSVNVLYGPRAAVEAIKAGNDVIVLPQNLDGAFRAIVEAVRKGEIARAQIDQSVRKILQMKASVGLHRSRLVDLENVRSAVSAPEDLDFAQHIADEANTLVRDNGKVLPLRSDSSTRKHRMVVVLITESVAGSSGREFAKAFKARASDADIFLVDDVVAQKVSPEILKATRDAEKVIIAAYIYHTAARQTVVGNKSVNIYGLPGATGALLQSILVAASQKTAVIAMGSPYLIENFPRIQTYICTYATFPTSEVSAVKALFGEIQGRGRLPVTLPDVAPRGFSLPWPAATR